MSLDTLDKDEIIQFSKLADDWWNEEGSMSFLHSMSKIRTKYIKDAISHNFKIAKTKQHLEGIKILDIFVVFFEHWMEYASLPYI